MTESTFNQPVPVNSSVPSVSTYRPLSLPAWADDEVIWRQYESLLVRVREVIESERSSTAIREIFEEWLTDGAISQHDVIEIINNNGGGVYDIDECDIGDLVYALNERGIDILDEVSTDDLADALMDRGGYFDGVDSQELCEELERRGEFPNIADALDHISHARDSLINIEQALGTK